MKIIVAEDSEVCRQVLAETFALRPDWEVKIVASATSAWWYLTEPTMTPYDLLITDLHMPEVAGFELVQRVRNDAQLGGLSVIVCSADQERTTVARIVQLRTNGYVLKPYRPNAMLQKIESLFANRPRRQISMALGTAE